MPTGVYNRSEKEKERLRQMVLNQSPEVREKRRQKMIGHPTSEETKRKISEAQIGKTITEEAKAKIRIARAKQVMQPMSEETKKKIGDKNRGKKYGPMSDAAKKNLSEKNKGKIISEEQRILISKAHKGKKATPETIEKLRLSHLGYKPTLETRKKQSEALRGEKSHNWKGGIHNEVLLARRSFEYKIWREECFKRDNWTCRKSGVRTGGLEVHHIVNFSDNEDLRFDINNGVTLSKKIHEEFHKIYGYRNNTQEQLDEFLNNNYAITDNTDISGGAKQNIGTEVTGESGVTETCS